MNWQQQNNKVYDKSAEKLAEYFASVGPRVDDIERALELASARHGARVIELGCGDGRDAVEIVKRVEWYEGIDPSVGLLDIARAQAPNISFVLSDAIAYEYPENLDVIFAFASLLHVNQNGLRTVFEKAARALRAGGIFYISLKERPLYTEEVQADKFGERMFYYYNAEITRTVAGGDFETAYIDRYTLGNTDWFSIALRRT